MVTPYRVPEHQRKPSIGVKKERQPKPPHQIQEPQALESRLPQEQVIERWEQQRATIAFYRLVEK